MKLSVIIPVYNAENYIERCVNSVLSQTLKDFEILLINDGSNDRSEELIANYEKAYPDVIRAISVENGGQGRARNIGLSMARGEYIGFVDSDDWIDPTMYEKMITTMECSGKNISVCGMTGHFDDGNTAEEFCYRPDRIISAANSVCNKVFRKESISGISFPEGLWYEDFEYSAIALFQTGDCCFLPDTFYHYRRGHVSTMTNNNARKNLDILRVMEHIEMSIREEQKDDFEFLILNHVLLEAIKRVNEQESADKKEVIRELRNYVRTRIPDLSRCRSFREESRNRRIIMKLNYDGFEKVSGYLLKAKQSLT